MENQIETSKIDHDFSTSIQNCSWFEGFPFFLEWWQKPRQPGAPKQKTTPIVSCIHMISLFEVFVRQFQPTGKSGRFRTSCPPFYKHLRVKRSDDSQTEWAVSWLPGPFGELKGHDHSIGKDFLNLHVQWVLQGAQHRAVKPTFGRGQTAHKMQFRHHVTITSSRSIGKSLGQFMPFMKI